MLTLYELEGQLRGTIEKGIPATPRRSILRNSDVGVLTEVVIDDDTMLQVYKNGLVLYETAKHHTVFPITDALRDYTYDSVMKENDGKNVIQWHQFRQTAVQADAGRYEGRQDRCLNNQRPVETWQKLH